MGKLKEVKLKDVIKVINGRAYKKPELLNDGKYRVLRVGNLFTNNSWYYSNLELPENKYCDKGDLIYAWSASFGPRIWKEGKVIYHYHIWKMICDETVINKDFAFQFLDWDKDMMKKEHSRGVGMFHLTKSAIEDRKLFLPTLQEQKRIVDKLDGLFAKIDQAIGLLEENIAHTQALMGSVLDEEFGKLDCKSFGLKSISEKIQYGYTGKTKEKGKYYYLRITDIQDSRVNFNKAPFSDISEEEAAKYILNQGDILFARTGATAGKSYLFNDKEPSIFASYLIRVVVKQDKLSPDYLKWYFQSDEYWNQIFGNIVGAAQPNFNGKKLGELNIPVPNLEIQNKCVLKFEEYDKVIRSSIKSQTKKLNYLKALKSSLLDQAFKGEL
jgi:type I restriction enzyme S subunit